MYGAFLFDSDVPLQPAPHVRVGDQILVAGTVTGYDAVNLSFTINGVKGKMRRSIAIGHHLVGAT